ncbi:hypothetical protein CNECB9_3480037 [Cupriavidus necator]|uniref:Uncharacterized protein n=1 Tax=Cupriavidus necator TaxID=106590 RepID=A0A1K0JCL8_CUPNE|nr:hypothetical protein CNECB9_3480037 [Cupriavidus necator]
MSPTWLHVRIHSSTGFNERYRFLWVELQANLGKMVAGRTRGRLASDFRRTPPIENPYEFR